MKGFFCRGLVLSFVLAVCGCGDTPTGVEKAGGAGKKANGAGEQIPPPNNSVPQGQPSASAREYDQALARAKAEGKAVFVEFSAGWCPPCQQMKRITFANADVQTRLADFVTVFVDADTGPDLLHRFGVKGIPAYFVVGPDEKPLRSGAGYLSPRDFLRWLNGTN